MLWRELALRAGAFVWASILLVFTAPSVSRAELGDANYTIRHYSTPDDRGFGNDIYYQIFVDRFANGNPNNPLKVDPTWVDQSKGDWRAYWGGDIRGIIQRAGYLKALGITRLWLTPIFEPQNVQVTEHVGEHDVQVGPNHGYWTRDFKQLNPLFTDKGVKDYDIVAELAEKLGPSIKLVLDVVLNHSSPTHADPKWYKAIEAQGGFPQADQFGKPTAVGAVFDEGKYKIDYNYDVERAKADPNYVPFFNHNPRITDFNNQDQRENWSLFGLADFDQRNPEVQGWLKSIVDFWMQKNPNTGGFRFDAFRHVPMWFWKQVSEYIQTKYPGVQMLGEYYGSTPADEAGKETFRETQITLFDFGFAHAMRDIFLENKPFWKLTDLWRADHTTGDARPYVTFIDNHDMPRLRGQGASNSMMRQALGLMFASRGVPALYYGIEQDLFHPGDPGDPTNRPEMKTFDPKHPLFRLVRTLIQARKENPAFRWGDTHIVHQSDDILAFEREYEGHKAFFALSKNLKRGTDDFEIVGLTLPDGEYFDVINRMYHTVKDGKMKVSLGYGDMMMFTKPLPPPPKSEHQIQAEAGSTHGIALARQSADGLPKSPASVVGPKGGVTHAVRALRATPVVSMAGAGTAMEFSPLALALNDAVRKTLQGLGKVPEPSGNSRVGEVSEGTQRGLTIEGHATGESPNEQSAERKNGSGKPAIDSHGAIATKGNSSGWMTPSFGLGLNALQFVQPGQKGNAAGGAGTPSLAANATEAGTPSLAAIATEAGSASVPGHNTGIRPAVNASSPVLVAGPNCPYGQLNRRPPQ